MTFGLQSSRSEPQTVSIRGKLQMSLAGRYMVLATICFTSLGAVVKKIEHLPTLQIVFFRALISLVLISPLLFYYRISLKSQKPGLLLARSLFGTAGLFIFFYTIQQMPLASAMTLNYLIPLFTILIASFVNRERSDWKIYISFVFAFCGVLMIKGFDTRVSTVDTLIALSGCALAALAHSLVRRLSTTEPNLRIVFYFPFVTTVLILPFLPFFWVDPEPTDWIFLGLTGVLTLIAQILLTAAYSLERASRVSHFIYLGGVLALFYGTVFFGESIPALALGGIVLILFGVSLVSFFARSNQ